MKKYLWILLIICFLPFEAIGSMSDLEKWKKVGFCRKTEKKSDYIIVQNRNIYGDLTVCSGEKKMDVAAFGKTAQRLGYRTVYQSDGRFYGKKERKKNGFVWLIYNPSDSMPLQLLHQKIYGPGDAFEMVLENGDDRFFYIRDPGDRYVSLEVKLPEKSGRFHIESSYETRYGKLKTSFHYSKTIDGTDTVDHLLLDLPQAEGIVRYACSYTGSYPATVRLKVGAEANLTKLRKGDKLGGILLKNVPFGKVRAVSEGDVTYSHPSVSELNFQGDRTSDGHAIFWLPRGYWRLEVTGVDGNEKQEGEAHFVPVDPGVMTEVTWPAIFARQMQANNGTSLEILKTSLKEKDGFVDFSFLNLETEHLPLQKGLTITEAGAKARITAVRKLKIPPHVVILLDSSGSMKRSMKKALTATAEFITKLPDDAKVSLIDFDTRAKLIANGSKKSALKALKKVRANGATALYDAVMKGLEILKNSKRPVMVLFTDGKDANYNDTAPGSETTQAALFEAIKKERPPIFTIGFGKSPDVQTLSRISALTKAKFYKARNRKYLADVYRTIEKNIAHQYRAYFKRPETGYYTARPVVHLMVDNSGSMEERLEKVRQVLRNFIEKLPEGFLV